MQKKICKIILGYILVLCLFGVWLGYRQVAEKFPVLEDAIFNEIIAEAQGEPGFDQQGKTGAGNMGKSDPAKIISPSESQENYWYDYKENKNQGPDSAKTFQRPEISARDKLRVLSIINKNLDSGDINLIVSMIKNGITPAEEAEIKGLLRRKIEAGEREELKVIIAKYL